MYHLIIAFEDQYEFGRCFVGLNSNKDFVFESEQTPLMYEVIKASDLFYMLVIGEAKFAYGTYFLSLDEVKVLYNKLANRSYHYQN